MLILDSSFAQNTVFLRNQKFETFCVCVFFFYLVRLISLHAPWEMSVSVSNTVLFGLVFVSQLVEGIVTKTENTRAAHCTNFALADAVLSTAAFN